MIDAKHFYKMLKDSTDTILNVVKGTPDPAFDRVKYAANIRARRERGGPVVPGAYDRDRFMLAHKQYLAHPQGLTDDDIAQLSLVDHDIAEEARAARVGFTNKKHGENDAALAQMPVSLLGLVSFVGHAFKQAELMIGTVVRLARESAVRIDAIEQRLNDPNDVPAMNVQLEPTVKKLVNRVERIDSHVRSMDAYLAPKVTRLGVRVDAIEAKPDLQYHGVYQPGVTYAAGSAVTWRRSIWIALESTAAMPDTGGPGARPWQLAVPAGRDGKDAK